MENKKAERADLEKRWAERFLLGLIFALALLFAGLEFTTRPAGQDDAGLLLDDMAEDMELMPVMERYGFGHADSSFQVADREGEGVGNPRRTHRQNFPRDE